MSAPQKRRVNSPSQLSESCNSGICNQQILVLVFERIKWDLHALCHTASVSRKLHAIANRLLWKELCVYRAPRMVAALADASANGAIPGGWHALAKLLFYCGGCESTRHFRLSRDTPGHFINGSRFSKTSGGSFLARRCRGDTLYVSDPCEHENEMGNSEHENEMDNREDDLGIYRGVFRGFKISWTRACLVGRQVALEERVRCPYCGARVWSMTSARLLTRSAARRLGSSDGGLEYFVCVNGHLHGTCWLVSLSSDEDGNKNDGGDDGC